MTLISNCNRSGGTDLQLADRSIRHFGLRSWRMSSWHTSRQRLVSWCTWGSLAPQMTAHGSAHTSMRPWCCSFWRPRKQFSYTCKGGRSLRSGHLQPEVWRHWLPSCFRLWCWRHSPPRIWSRVSHHLHLAWTHPPQAMWTQCWIGRRGFAGANSARRGPSMLSFASKGYFR